MIDKEYRIEPEINFSLEAVQCSKNLQNEVFEIDNIILLNNGEPFENDISTFFMKSQLKGINVDKIHISF